MPVLGPFRRVSKSHDPNGSVASYKHRVLQKQLEGALREYNDQEVELLRVKESLAEARLEAIQAASVVSTREQQREEHLLRVLDGCVLSVHRNARPRFISNGCAF